MADVCAVDPRVGSARKCRQIDCAATWACLSRDRARENAGDQSNKDCAQHDHRWRTSPPGRRRLPAEMSTSSVSASIRPSTVALVGRPNVGKSSLFNRLIGQRLAIVDETPGVTRDRLYALTEWRGRMFTLVDTAGIDTDSPSDSIEAKTRAQAEAAANDADVIVFVVDAAAGLN